MKISELKHIINEEVKNILEYNKAADDVARNFKRITNVDPVKLFDKKTGEFFDDMIEKTFPKIEKYVTKKYNIDPFDEDFLGDLDEKILQLYS